MQANQLLQIDKAYRESKLTSGVAIRMHYRVCGCADNPPLLLLHQSPSSSAMYERLMPLLADRYFCIAPDSPGFGSSDALPDTLDHSIANYADAIAGLLSALNLAPCVVFGHHTGASVAVQLAHDFPNAVLALSLSGPTLLSAEQRQQLPQLAAPFAESEAGSHFQQMWQRIRGKDSQVSMDITERETLLALKCKGAYQAAYQAVCDQNFADLLPELSCPVQVFAGEKDGLLHSVQPTLDLLQDGYFYAAPTDAGTYICDTHAVEVAKMLSDFIEQIGFYQNRDGVC